MTKSFMENILPGVPTPNEKTVLGVKMGIRQRQEKRYNSDKLKHTGFLGVIYLPDGTHMTEQSISPKELENTPYAKKRGVEIPILVPANKKYLEDAIESLIEGKDPKISSTDPVGCTIKWKINLIDL